tara:strand:+ start:384 stop:722 length:339 start_codon:yes stop_codon:yes gene_type:complete
MKISSIIDEVVRHPKWSWSKGMLVCPTFKLTQKVRLSSTQNEHNKGWLPVLEDRSTLACMSLLIVESGGKFEYKQGRYFINERYESEDLSKIICEGLLDTWNNQSSSVSKNS